MLTRSNLLATALKSLVVSALWFACLVNYALLPYAIIALSALVLSILWECRVSTYAMLRYYTLCLLFGRPTN